MEALERRGKLVAVAAIVFIVFWSQCKGVEGQRNNTKMTYVCPPDFIRLGHSCYFFSENKASWQDALTACRDRETHLVVPARWEDRNLRTHLSSLQTNKTSRWIGGIYDSEARSWRWGGDLRKMHYDSFSKMKKMSHEELKYHCIAMVPQLHYKWSPENCFERREYICQTKLRKETKPKMKELRKRWQRMGKPNEITAPSISREVNDPMMVNDVTANPIPNPKSYDLRPIQSRLKHSRKGHGNKSYDQRANSLRKRSRSSIRSRRLKRPFPGYTWNRRDPEGSYQRNAALLRSGRTGLRPQQINSHLARLQRLRDKQIQRRLRNKEKDDWLENVPRQAFAHVHPRTYTVDNHISALHPKTIVEEFDMFPAPAPAAKPNSG